MVYTVAVEKNVFPKLINVTARVTRGIPNIYLFGNYGAGVKLQLNKIPLILKSIVGKEWGYRKTYVEFENTEFRLNSTLYTLPVLVAILESVGKRTKTNPLICLGEVMLDAKLPPLDHYYRKLIEFVTKGERFNTFNIENNGTYIDTLFSTEEEIKNSNPNKKIISNCRKVLILRISQKTLAPTKFLGNKTTFLISILKHQFKNIHLKSNYVDLINTPIRELNLLNKQIRNNVPLLIENTLNLGVERTKYLTKFRNVLTLSSFCRCGNLYSNTQCTCTSLEIKNSKQHLRELIELHNEFYLIDENGITNKTSKEEIIRLI